MAIPAPTVIIPRWEWRLFAPSMKMIEDKVGAAARIDARESAEIYFLDLAGSGLQNAKIREHTFDLKELQQIDADGLELWKPVFRAAFPLQRADIISAFRYWSLTPTLNRDSYSVDQFIDELITPQPTLRVVHVFKSRRSFQYGGCIAEFTRLALNGQPLASFSLEHEEPACIIKALRELGLDSRLNTNYQVGLKRALGLDKTARSLRRTPWQKK